MNGSRYGSHGSYRCHRNVVAFAKVIDGLVVAAAGVVVGGTIVVAVSEVVAAVAEEAVGVTVMVVVEGVLVIVEVGQEVRVEVGV